MNRDLVQKLRTCSLPERKDAALSLAHRGTDKDIEELIRMVKGRRRHGLSWYNFQDQLIGVEALGETSRQTALNFLTTAYTPVRKVVEDRTYGQGGGSEPMNDDVYGTLIVECYFLKANGALKKQLSYTERVTYNPKYADGQDTSILEKNLNVHDIFNSAIEKLTASLNIPPSK
jgi:hypothetical protein